MSNPTQPPHDSGSGERASRDEPNAPGAPLVYGPVQASAWRIGWERGYRAALATPSQAPEPTAAKALEFAEYMAKGGEQLLEAINTRFGAVEARDNLEGDASEDDLIAADQRIDRAEEALSDFMRGFSADIYEFRKRAAKVGPSQAVASALHAPEGWKLVPEEPTVEMLMAGEDAYDSSSFRESRMYKAMLAAAPAHPVVQPAPECQQCHQPKTLNPHPKAGDPSLEFGYVWECIPCLVRTRSSAVKRYCAAEAALKELQAGHQAGASLLLACDSRESERGGA